MIINYELNPPKILPNKFFDYNRLLEDIEIVRRKVLLLEKVVDCIHFTDSVLGIPRLASVTMAGIIKKNNESMKISCSVRTRDRNHTAMYQIVAESMLLRIESLLVLFGDKSIDEVDEKITLKPSNFVKELNGQEINKFIRLNLSIPNKLKSIDSIRRKIDANPYAFVTQSIQSIDDLGNMVDLVKPFKIKIIACIMLPSEKNKRSAELIGLDWQAYEKEPIEFVTSIGKIADQVLLTSPNHFLLATEFLKQIRR